MHLHYHQCAAKSNCKLNNLESWSQYFYILLHFTPSISCGKCKKGERVQIFLFCWSVSSAQNFKLLSMFQNAWKKETPHVDG